MSQLVQNKAGIRGSRPKGPLARLGRHRETEFEYTAQTCFIDCSEENTLKTGMLIPAPQRVRCLAMDILVPICLNLSNVSSYQRQSGMFGYVSVVCQFTHPAHGYCRSEVEYPYNRRELFGSPGAEVFLGPEGHSWRFQKHAHRATGALAAGRIRLGRAKENDLVIEQKARGVTIKVVMTRLYLARYIRQDASTHRRFCASFDVKPQQSSWPCFRRSLPRTAYVIRR